MQTITRGLPQSFCLYPNQRLLQESVRDAWTNGKPAFFYAGQRAGKSVVMADLALTEEPQLIISLGLTRTLAENLTGCLHNLMSHGRLCCYPSRVDIHAMTTRAVLDTKEHPLDLLGNPNPKQTIALFDDFAWDPAAEAAIATFHDLGIRCAAFSTPSNTPCSCEKTIPRWATWEINPTLPWTSDFITRRYAEDAVKAWRDFGCNKPEYQHHPNLGENPNG